MRGFSGLLLLGLAAVALQGQVKQTAPLRLVASIPLPNVQGRIDHFSCDLKGMRLLMSARGMLGEIHRPQGIPCNLIETLP